MTGSIQEVGPVATAGEREAHQRLHAAAIALVAARRGDTFPASGSTWEEFIATARKVCPDLLVVRPGGQWPADLLGRVAVLVAEDGSAMLLMTEMIRIGAFPGSGDDLADRSEALPETEFLTVHKDGRSYLGSSEATASLLGLAPTRQARDQS